MKLLITGGTGTLGSHLVRLAQQSGHWEEIHSTYHNLNPNFHRVYWHYVDARNGIYEVLKKTNPTHILHTLAMTSPDECEGRKLEAWEVNVKVTQEVAQFCEDGGIRLVFTSSDLIFDGKKGDYSESDAADPVNFYGDTKVEAENVIRECMLSGAFCIARLSLLYGSNRNGRTTFFDLMVSHIKNGKTLELYENQIRSMLSVVNASEMLLALMRHDFVGTLHLGGPDPISRFGFGKKLAECLEKPEAPLAPIVMETSPGRARRPANVALNTNLAQETLAVKALDIVSGLHQVLSQPPIY